MFGTPYLCYLALVGSTLLVTVGTYFADPVTINKPDNLAVALAYQGAGLPRPPRQRDPDSTIILHMFAWAELCVPIIILPLAHLATVMLDRNMLWFFKTDSKVVAFFRLFRYWSLTALYAILTVKLVFYILARARTIAKGYNQRMYGEALRNVALQIQGLFLWAMTIGTLVWFIGCYGILNVCYLAYRCYRARASARASPRSIAYRLYLR